MPETQKEEPETQNDEPETHNDEPETQKDEPETQNDEPETQKDEPEAEKDVPETQNDEPETQNDEPEAKKDVPESQNDEPETQNDEPETQKDEPEAEKVVPETQNGEPETQNDEPETQKDEPEAEKDVPETQNELEAEKDVPESQNDEPETQNDEPETQNDEPETQNDEPETQNNEPETQIRKPDTLKGEPESLKDESKTERDEPESQNDEHELEKYKLESQNDEPEPEKDKSQTKNDEPEAENDKPQTKNDEPEPENDKPQTKNDEPEPEKDEPETKNDESKPENDKPQTKNEPKPENVKLQTKNDEPEPENDEPEPEKEEPEYPKAEPDNKNDECEVGKDETEKGEPETKREQLEVKKVEYQTEKDKPEAKKDEPETKKVERKPKEEEPEKSNDKATTQVNPKNGGRSRRRNKKKKCKYADNKNTQQTKAEPEANLTIKSLEQTTATISQSRPDTKSANHPSEKSKPIYDPSANITPFKRASQKDVQSTTDKAIDNRSVPIKTHSKEPSYLGKRVKHKSNEENNFKKSQPLKADGVKSATSSQENVVYRQNTAPEKIPLPPISTNSNWHTQSKKSKAYCHQQKIPYDEKAAYAQAVTESTKVQSIRWPKYKAETPKSEKKTSARVENQKYSVTVSNNQFEWPKITPKSQGKSSPTGVKAQPQEHPNDKVQNKPRSKKSKVSINNNNNNINPLPHPSFANSINSQDMQELRSYQWLTDKHIDAVMGRLRSEHPHIAGLQDTVLQSIRMWDVVRTPYVQIFLVNNNHWIMASTVRAPPNNINIYDSLMQKPKQDTLDMIACYHSSNSKDLKFNIMNVQRQENTVDCGAFALAFLTSIIANQDPTQMTFSNPRGHLIKCFTDGKISPFPSCKFYRKKEITHSITIKNPVY